MNSLDANRTAGRYELKDELARLCLPAAARDSDRKLAWTNSICILFLLIGLFGAKPASTTIKPAPPLEEVIPTIIEPLPPPPQTVTAIQNRDETEPDKSEAPQVVVVAPESPNISFAVPTIGTLVVPSAVALPPPLRPSQLASADNRLTTLNNTGAGGERPQPPYPKIALEQGQQGTVTLLMSADQAGNVISIEVKKSSGSAVLDRGALDYVRRHWTLPVGASTRLFETSITYRLQNG